MFLCFPSLLFFFFWCSLFCFLFCFSIPFRLYPFSSFLWGACIYRPVAGLCCFFPFLFWWVKLELLHCSSIYIFRSSGKHVGIAKKEEYGLLPCMKLFVIVTPCGRVHFFLTFFLDLLVKCKGTGQLG